MIVLGVLLLLFFLIAILPLGVSVLYSEEGFFLNAHAGPVKLALIPKPERPEKPKKEKKEKPKEEKPEEKKKSSLPVTPGGLVSLLQELVPALAETLDRLRRKLTIHELSLYYTSAAADPFDAAMNYGRVSAILEAGQPSFRRWFRIKQMETGTAVSFDGEGDRIYISAKLSLRVWEIVYIVLGLFPVLKAFLAMVSEAKKRKAE